MSIRKRFYARHQISLDVSVREREGWVHYRTVDVSRRGVFLRSEKPSPLNRLLQMRVELPTGTVLDVMGRVRRSLLSVEEGPGGPGMGIEFFVMSQQQQDDWDAFVLAQPRGESGHETSDSGISVPESVELDLPERPDSEGAPTAGATVMGIPRDEVRNAVAAAVDRANLKKAIPAAEVRHRPPPGATMTAESVVTESASMRPMASLDAVLAPQPEASHVTPPPLPDSALPPLPAATEPAPETAEDRLPEAVHVNVRPATRENLEQFVIRRLAGRNIFLRVDADVVQGQAALIVLVHPETDCELHMEAAVKEALPAEEGHDSGMLVGFEPADGRERSRLRRFVELGSESAVDAEEKARLRHEGLKAAALSEPDSAMAHTNLGWPYVGQRKAPETAVESFLAALAIDGDCIAAHRGLSLAYKLTGDANRAYAFASSWRQLEQRREAAEDA